MPLKTFPLPLIIIFLALLFLSSKGQNKSDSLIHSVSELPDTSKIKLLNQWAKQFLFSDNPLSKKLAEASNAISQRIDSDPHRAASALILCTVLNLQGEFSQALEWCNTCETLYQKLGDKRGLAEVLNRIGMVHSQQGRYALALENLLKSLKMKQELNLKNEIPLSVENIGIVYFRQGDYELALKYFKECYDEYQQLNNLASATKILVNLGATYNRLKMHDKALESNLQSLTYFEKMNNSTGIGIASNNVGNVYIEMKDYARAVKYYLKSLEVKQKMNDKRGTALSLSNLADAYLGLGNLSKAKESVDRSLQIAEEIGAKEQIKDAYNILAKMYEKTKDYEKALQYEKKMSQAKDSLFSHDKTEQISRMRVAYETEKAEQEARITKLEADVEIGKRDAAIAVLNKDNELKNAQRNISIVAAMSLLVVASLVFYFYRQKKQANAILTEKNNIIEKSLQEREALLKEIHHRVKNNLQIISSILSLQSKKLIDQSAQGAISESRNRVKSMSLIHEQLYQEDTISGVKMAEYLQGLVGSLTASYGLDSDRVEVKIEADELLLDVDTAIPLGLIVNELVSNSMKYAFPNHEHGKILISLHDMMSELKLVVQDDGVGIDQSKEKEQSFGLTMVKSLMRKLKAEMNIQSDSTIPRAGTLVELVIRDFKKITFA